MAMAKAKKALSLALAALFAAGTVFSFAPAANAAVAKKVVVNYYNNALANIRAINAELLLNKDLSVVANRVEITKQFNAYKANMAKETNATKKAALVKMFDSVWAAYQKMAAEDIAASKGANLTVTSVANPADITVTQGASVTLPTTVEATMSDNSKKQVSVTWNGTVDTKVAGDVTIAGKAEGKDVSVKVSVKAIEVKVDSVAVKTAQTIEVKFNTAVDTTKVKFDVKRETTPMTLSATWNADKTVATLTGASKFPLGNYAVSVTNDAKDLGKTELKVEQEKVAAIKITSDVLSIQQDGKTGYVTYKVENQYGQDITNTNIASIQWTVAGGTAQEATNAQKGVLQIIASNDVNLLNLSQVTITGVDNTANVVGSATLKVATAAGTISDIKLVKITQKDNKDLVAGDSSLKWNIEYEAKDMAGNPTSNFKLLKAGLNDSQNPVADEIKLTTSGYITAKVVDVDGKAVIELKTDGSKVTTDIPVTVTAITKTGKTSTLNLTLKKQSETNDFRLMPPYEDIAYGDAKEVPFVAYDQNGTQLTKLDDIVNKASVKGGKYYTAMKNSAFSLTPMANIDNNGQILGEGFYFMERGDQTAKLMYQAPAANGATNDTTKVLTASTNTGKFSSISINIRKTANASSLSMKDVVITKLVQGAGIRIHRDDFTAKDQYGRTMSKSDTLYVEAQLIGAGNPLVLTKAVADRNNHIFIDAPAVEGTYSIKFTLKDMAQADPAKREVATKTVDFTVIKESDISDITVSAKDNKVFNTNGFNDAQEEYEGSVVIYGLDSNGNKVVLPKSYNTAFNIAQSNGDALVTQDAQTTAYNNMNKIYFKVSKALDNGQKETNTVVTVSKAINGAIKSVAFNVTSSNETAVAQSITAKDEVSFSDYATTAVMADIIKVLDQYDGNMINRDDNSVIYYVDGVKMVVGAVNDTFKPSTDAGKFIPSSILVKDLQGYNVTVVANNGISKTVIFKGTKQGGVVVDPAVTAATALVVKAEGSKLQADKDAALAAVNALTASADKTALLARVNAIVVTPPAGDNFTATGVYSYNLILGDLVTITATDVTKVTAVKVNDANADFQVKNGKIVVSAAKTDAIKVVTAAGEYTVTVQ